MRFMHLNQNLQSFVSAARLCLKEGHVLPALALVYSMIDHLAYIDMPDSQEDVLQEDFVRWVDTYLLPDSGLPCSALDLYAARCGLLHSQSPNSRLFRKGKASKLCYAWGETTREEVQSLADRLNYPAVAVRVEDLIQALVVAENRFGTFINETPERAVIAAERARGVFSAIPPAMLEGGEEFWKQLMEQT